MLWPESIWVMFSRGLRYVVSLNRATSKDLTSSNRRPVSEVLSQLAFMGPSMPGYTRTRRNEATKINFNVSNRYMRTPQCHLPILLWRHTYWYYKNQYHWSWEMLPHCHYKIIIYKQFQKRERQFGVVISTRLYIYHHILSGTLHLIYSTNI